MTKFGPLISTRWLADHIGFADVKIIDGSWRMPGNPPARADYEKRHIEGAVFFDVDEIADCNTDLPHMLPSSSQFSEQVSELGISEKARVVIYDDQGLFSAARVWWTFRAMGHGSVAILDGGLRKWLAESRAVSASRTIPLATTYTANPVTSIAVTCDEMRQVVKTNAIQILDARPASRFSGDAPEPRTGLRCGHMPGAANLPASELVGIDGRLRSKDDLVKLFIDAGVDYKKPVITTCGSGVTAAIVSLALEIVGSSDHRLYDGSWAAWGAEQNDPEEFPVIGR